jgi:Zn-dependent protease with chaperone function
MFNYTKASSAYSESSSSGQSDSSSSGHGETDLSDPQFIAYAVITPVASYVALAFVVLFLLIIIVSKLVITVETTKSDLVIYNTTPQKLELLVSKPASNSGAQHNVHAAIALGLMEAPPNYQPPKPKMNGFAHANAAATTSNVSEAADGEPVRRKKNFK